MNQSFEIRLNGLRILVVDDAPDNRLLVSRFLNLAGAQTDVAADGTQGIEMARTKNFDAILMDIQMPGMDGYEAVSRLRALGFTRPIIALTAHAMRGEKERCLKNGFDAYLTKPIARLDLIKMVHLLIVNFKKSTEDPAATLTGDILQDPEQQPDLRGARQTPNHNPHSQ